jgi:hypothetical protein
VLVDGETANGSYNDGTYAFDPSTFTWSELAPAIGPAPRAEAGFSYDPSTGTLVQFGGYSAAGFQADTWLGQLPGLLSSATWRLKFAGQCRRYAIALRCLSRRST